MDIITLIACTVCFTIVHLGWQVFKVTLSIAAKQEGDQFWIGTFVSYAVLFVVILSTITGIVEFVRIIRSL